MKPTIYHLTRLQHAMEPDEPDGCYGHTVDHCDEGGCNGSEMYLGPCDPSYDPTILGKICMVVDGVVVCAPVNSETD